ncbi:MAG: LamG domain-containing protein [Candidatus Nanohaloarchaea archaeon]|nr:LamG domain-containing protein [Candidatus Nanohaloarchaea archaeon]
MRRGQFFIITAVLIAGTLLSITTLLASSQTVSYDTVLQRHTTDVLQNIATEVQAEWWNVSWDYRKTVVLEERSGSFLDNESIAVTLDARDGRVTDDCSDIRVVDDGRTVPWVATTACGIETYDSNTTAVARYTLDAGSGGTAEDVTVHEHDGSLSGSPVWTSGRFETGLAFTGSDSVDVPDSDDLDFTGDGFTVSLWLRPRTAATGSFRQVLVKGDGTSNGGRNYGIWLRPNQNTLHVRVDPNNQGIDASDTELEPGRWHHVTAVYDGDADELRLYVDGRHDTTETGVTMDSSSDNDGELHVGASPNFDAADAVVDDVRVYDRALSAGTVEGIARNGIGLNVSADLAPLAEETLHVYYRNPGAADPGYDGSSMSTTSLSQRPSVTVGPARGILEVMRKLQERVEQLDAALGINLRLEIRRGCNRLHVQSPRTSLVKELC